MSNDQPPVFTGFSIGDIDSPVAFKYGGMVYTDAVHLTPLELDELSELGLNMLSLHGLCLDDALVEIEAPWALGALASPESNAVQTLDRFRSYCRERLDIPTAVVVGIHHYPSGSMVTVDGIVMSHGNESAANERTLP